MPYGYSRNLGTRKTDIKEVNYYPSRIRLPMRGRRKPLIVFLDKCAPLNTSPLKLVQSLLGVSKSSEDDLVSREVYSQDEVASRHDLRHYEK